MLDVMRTTLDIDEDVLQAAKELAAVRRLTAGQAISALARSALESSQPVRKRNGVPVLPRRPTGSSRSTMKRVNELRDEE